MDKNKSVKKISKELLDEIVSSLQSAAPYGSVEIYLQNNNVTQVTVRKIKKTNGHAVSA